MLKTTFRGEALLHRLLWGIVEEEAQLAKESEREWFNRGVVAMVFASHTVEAYLNFVGERLDPEIWKDEREFFRNEPYRGFEGKLRKVVELAALPWSPEDRPLKTILELKDLRDLIAHAKPEKLAGEIVHPADTDIRYPTATLSTLVSKEKLATAMSDVEQFLNQIHSGARPKIKANDTWFGSEALRGPEQYTERVTTPH